MLLTIDIFGYTSRNYGRHNIVLYPDKLNMYDFNVAQIYGIPLGLLWNSYSLAVAQNLFLLYGHKRSLSSGNPFFTSKNYKYRRVFTSNQARIACEKRRLQRNVWRKGRAKYMCGPVGLL